MLDRFSLIPLVLFCLFVFLLIYFFRLNKYLRLGNIMRYANHLDTAHLYPDPDRAGEQNLERCTRKYSRNSQATVENAILCC